MVQSRAGAVQSLSPVHVALGLSDQARSREWARELRATGGVGEVTCHHSARAAVDWAAWPGGGAVDGGDAADGPPYARPHGSPYARGGRDGPRTVVSPLAVVALAEVGEGEAGVIAAAGVRVLLVVDDVAEVDLGRVTRVRSAGVVDGRHCNADALGDCLRQIHAGQVPLPPPLARRLLAPGRREQDPAPAPRLTPREQQTLALLVEGLSNKQIARRLTISEHGAKRLVGNIMAKLDAPNRTCAVTRALRQGLHREPHRLQIPAR